MRSPVVSSLTLAFVTLAVPAAAQIGPGPFAAFPSADVTDGRMLSFGCAGIETFEQKVTLTIAVPPGETSFTLSLFDGDTGGPQPASPEEGHWDVGSRQLLFALYNDPYRTGICEAGALVGLWAGNEPNPTVGATWVASAATMPDNDWWGVTVSVTPDAQGPDGYSYYNLVITTDGSCEVGETLASDLKVAASSPMTFLVPRFGFEASLRQFLNDGPIIYPGPFPPLGFDFIHAPTTFDGLFEFFLVVPPGADELVLYDGDFDLGTNPLGLFGLPSNLPIPACPELDDPDTPADYSTFPADLDLAGAAPEGACPCGQPSDDTLFDVFRRGEPGDPGRMGCVRYELTDPEGTVYANSNPSGNREWEQFRIVGSAHPDAHDATKADYTAATPTLPPGAWQVRIYGLDLSNLNFWFADTCSMVDGEPACPPERCPPGTGTPGFWKNHPGAWPVDELTLGGMTYSKEEAIAWLRRPVKDDKSVTLFYHQVAATLNALVGNETGCVELVMAEADAWLALYPVGSGVSAGGSAWSVGEPLSETLDAYNNGQLCAPARGEPGTCPIGETAEEV